MTATIESKKKFCSRCAIQLRGHAGQFCEECTSIIEIENALKKKKELELKQLLQQQKQKLPIPTLTPTPEAISISTSTQTATVVEPITNTATTAGPTKIGSFYYPRSLWQEIAVPILNPEKDSDTKTTRFAVFQQSPQRPTHFIVEERDSRYYYGGEEYKRDSMYFYEALIPDLSVEKGYKITSHKQGFENQDFDLDDPKLLKRVEVRCNCNCNNGDEPNKKCEHKIAVVTFLKIKKLFKQHYNNIGDIERLLPGGEVFATYDPGKKSLVYTPLYIQEQQQDAGAMMQQK